MKVQKGFTLIELLITITIIGVMAGGLIIIIDPVKQLQKARDGKRKSEIAQIQQALELYRSDVGSYPVGSSFDTCGVSTKLQAGNVTYMQQIPCDPSGGVYKYIPSSLYTYDLWACLEFTSDAEAQGLKSCPSGRKSYSKTNP